MLNLGHATASEIVQLIALVKTKARNRFGIYLQEEIEYVGF
ncbi:MAG: UDP-N-acetylenolpyruvoylglucosamine reductase [Candidatus Uhrbacteria bacterium GW2011_GWC2_41_11]|uniref:UDP-N-acetylenolpyruvoylglucosamine reductase n=1 Tax=Candidatus Uhrbacteria bacterium GW2011_GWC2_41_11 TaxID=1618985 RepID=A0A0G0UFG1_9BACT|nr:MAG: UDP-N-acetylenolpyruvoylglucosamine reductase [Candidatus Uhrbacteria bacterium GW2011_GWC2_41_11]